MSTLLEVFTRVATNPATSDRTVVECSGERWTYKELHSITNILATQIFNAYGAKPIVGIISENHPYYIALLLAVWKLGGAVVPLDGHSPPHLMKAMLQNISPAFTVVQEMDAPNVRLVEDLGIPTFIIGDTERTISSLTTHFLGSKFESSSQSAYPAVTPEPGNAAAYIHTSSATSASNLKCVPITHAMIITNGSSQLEWFKRKLGISSADALRVLGWSTFSHAMSLCLDIGTSVLLTGGCYIFAVPPSSYDLQAHASSDVPKTVLEAILSYEPDAFSGVPWILDGIIRLYNAEENEAKRALMTEAFRKFKFFMTAGAATPAESIRWAKDQGLQVINAIGMTEIGGNIFNALAEDASGGWCTDDTCIPDAVYTLVDDHGEISDKGELYITSRYIAREYLKHENSAFTVDDNGVITFRTGDVYCYGSTPDRIIWKGRKDDFIQLKSGESLDPRPLEGLLNECPAVAHACIVGNTFLSGPADFTCAILQLTSNAVQDLHSAKLHISKVLASINGTLPPPLRIPWSKVLLLQPGQTIPYTKKGSVFRKKLQALFGEQLENRLRSNVETAKPIVREPVHSQEYILEVVKNAVSSTVGISTEDIDENSTLSFAELGMDSATAIKIVNKLNDALKLMLPPNTCHVYLDVESLTQFLCTKFSVDFKLKSVPPTSLKPQTIQVCEPVAIIGHALRLPGDINDSESFWQALVDKRTDILTATPEDRWDHESFVDDAPGQIAFSKSGFIDITSFDNAFFGIPSSEAVYISPSSRLALEVSYEALENANIPLAEVKGTDMGVFVASGLDTGYGQLLFQDKGYEAYTRFYGTGNAISATSGRLSYLLDVHGPSITVETACSGGMVALDQAVRHLQTGRGECTIVTGVNTHTLPGMFSFLSAQQMTSKNSRCATFSNEADGYATSEGVVSLILKTQSAAERDGDTILGVVKSTDTRHNGRTQGLIAPSVAAQAALQRSVLRQASLEPKDIDFMETHGTGTSLGDLMEIQGISEVFQDSHTASRPLVLGAAKSCVGHTETAAGLVGIVKTLESFSRHAIPGVTHLTESNLNPAIDVAAVPLHIPHRTYHLTPRQHVPYRALVVAYGFAGTISAAVIEAPSKKQQSPKTSIKTNTNEVPFLFVVSAKSEQTLSTYMKRYIELCRSSEETLIRSICYTSCVGREHYRYRFACVASSSAELVQKLEQRLQNSSEYLGTSRPRVLFGFPGQGSHFNGMARDLANAYSGFRRILIEYAQYASTQEDLLLLPLLLGTDQLTDGDERSEVVQACIYVFQCAMAAWLKALGVEPHAVLGHSLGEISAAVSSEALKFTDGLRFVVARARSLKSSPPSSGAMAAIAASEQVIHDYIASLKVEDRVVIAVSNGEESHVISGFADAVDLVLQKASLEGHRCVKLKVHEGFHSPSIKPGLATLGEWLVANKSCFSPLKMPFYSTVTSEKIQKGSCLPAEYWLAHARNPVKFWQTVSKLDTDDTTNIFLDIGPQPALWSHVQGLRKSAYSITAKQGSNQEQAFLEAVARLYENNVSLDLKKLYHERGSFIKTNVPTYPFQRQRHYPAYVPSRNEEQRLQFKPQAVPLLAVDQSLIDLIFDHRIEGRRVLPGIAFADLAAMGIEDSQGRMGNIRFHRPLVLDKAGSHIQAEIQRDGSFTISYGADKICSGSLTCRIPFKSSKVMTMEVPPLRVLNRETVYAPFEDQIFFGPAFQNIKEVSVWPECIQALVTVPTSSNQKLDRIRKLDPCLHLFGAVSQFMDVPERILKGGVYLPTSLQGFVLHSEDIPSEFYCRYYLPAELGDNYTTGSIRFDVISLSGELLASCEKYSVARLPKGVAIQTPAIDTLSGRWMQNSWRQEDILQDSSSPTLFGRDESVVYFSDFVNSAVLTTFGSAASEVFIAELGASDTIQYTETDPRELASIASLSAFTNQSLVDKLRGKKVSIVLDVTRYYAPGTETYTSLWKHALLLMKFTLDGSIDISCFVVVTSMSESTGPAYDLRQPPGLGTVLQGMLKVYRHESGLSPDVVWGVDLPDQVTPEDVSEILKKEIRMHDRSGHSKNTIAAYRHVLGCPENKSFTRLVPVLLPKDEEIAPPIKPMNGLAVVVGMGSIGQALAGYMASAGCTAIVFIGRRRSDDPEIVQGLESLRSTSPSATINYVQGDVTKIVNLRLSIDTTINRFGEVKHVVYTAGVIRDARISTVSDDDFAQVLDSKAAGAWNMHVISQKMKWSLDTFLLLSSISVPLGNEGQISYVAGNAFLDSLASYRRSIGLPGTSLQLGPWESKVIQGVDLSQTHMEIMSHAEGIPLVLRALSENDPVQVVVNWDAESVARSAAFASDAMFRELRLNTAKSIKEHPVKKGQSKQEVEQIIVSIVQEVLDVSEGDPFDLQENLVALGMDSISFAQMRGSVLQRTGIDIPVRYLSDKFSIGRMVYDVCDGVEED